MGSLPTGNLESLLMWSQNPLDPDEFRRQGHMIIDFLADHYNVESYPVRSQVEPGYLRKRLQESAPNNPLKTFFKMSLMTSSMFLLIGRVQTILLIFLLVVPLLGSLAKCLVVDLMVWDSIGCLHQLQLS
ncbi:hypothetical protein MKW94_011103 [Papaver nudicaule]|uniref:Uncharacterized protein n=1 Tax=Papaver nudicaule TaxID=74823 RepID=A0AA41UW16_PAPNU|nr:hypothetical protein [Papaver nudicaule]